MIENNTNEIISNIIEIHSRDQFDNCLKSDKLTIVDFWAEWCGPCRMMLPVLHKIAGDHLELQLLTINVDECPEIAGDEKFGVSSIPAIFFIRNGEVIDNFVGALPESEVLNKISKNNIINNDLIGNNITNN